MMDLKFKKRKSVEKGKEVNLNLLDHISHHQFKVYYFQGDDLI